jgi:nitrous oxidase accessory protein NosD
MVLGLVLVVTGKMAVADKFNKASCTVKGHKMYGRIREVTSAEDARVYVAKAAESLRVQQVTVNPNSCGRWQMVTSAEDTRVKFITAAEDVRIRYVTVNPGAN